MEVSVEVAVKTRGETLRLDQVSLKKINNLNLSAESNLENADVLSKYKVKGNNEETSLVVKTAHKAIMVLKSEDGKEYLAKSSTRHFSNSYRLTKENGKWVARVSGDITSFNKLQEKRKHGGDVPFEEQLEKNGYIDVTHVGTTMLLIANVTLKNGSRKRAIICPTREKSDGTWASGISGYVNGPIYDTLKREGHEEILLFDEEDNGIRINFGENDPEVFGLSYSRQIDARQIDPKEVPWLNVMEVTFVSEDGKEEVLPCFYDARTGNLQVIGVYEVDINLCAEEKTRPKTISVNGDNLQPSNDYEVNINLCAKEMTSDKTISVNGSNLQASGDYEVNTDSNDSNEIKIMSSETSCVNGELYEVFYGGQGRESKIIVLSLDKDGYLDGKAYKPNSESETGLEEVEMPGWLAEIFNTKKYRNGFASTNGDISTRCNIFPCV